MTEKSLTTQSLLRRLRSRGVSADAIHAFHVPGRIEFLGKHTDYAGGRSLICAVDRGFTIVASPRNDRQLQVLGDTAATELSFELHPDLAPVAGHWSNYPMTVARRIARNFPGPLRGADMAFSSDLPASSGLSSSSALIIAFFLALSAVNRLEDRDEYRNNILSVYDLAGYLGTIENGQSFGSLIGDRGVGTFGGSQDHTAILTGVAGQLSQCSFCPVRFERAVPLPVDHSLVIGVSGVMAEKTGAAQAGYNNASHAAAAVLAAWNAHSRRNDPTLADAVNVDAAAVRKCLTDQRPNDKLIDRLDQFVAESTQIIPAAGDALINGRLDLLGPLVDRSQELAEKLLRNQVPQTIALAQTARQLGAVAASSFGAGFGGSVWAMVPNEQVAAFLAEWSAGYRRDFPDAAERSAFFPATAGSPATRLPA
jgi:galactokinase